MDGKITNERSCSNWLHWMVAGSWILDPGGDGRSDSPGDCAKYGSYSMNGERVNKDVNIQLLF